MIGRFTTFHVMENLPNHDMKSSRKRCPNHGFFNKFMMIRNPAAHTEWHRPNDVQHL